MNKFKALIFLIAQLIAAAAFAQNGFLSGTLRDEANHPVVKATVVNKKTGGTTVTDSLGMFRFDNLPAGDYELEISRSDFKTYTEIVHHNPSDQVVALTVQGIATESAPATVDNLPTVSLSEDDMKDNGTGPVSSILSSARDPFVSAATFNFSAARFRVRGYDDDNFVSLMNNIPMNDLTNGRTTYNTWTGLNDVMRSRENSIGMAQVPYSFGGIGGAYSIDSRASRQREQLQVTYSASNRTYDNRFMVTWGSGQMANGWSAALSFSRRWADEGFVRGTFYDGNSFFASLEKKLNTRHSLSITAFGSMTVNARPGFAVSEMQDLAGTHYYNPNWGYQNNEVRSAVVGHTNQPMVILEHDWKINETSSLQTSIGLNNGTTRVSGLDWYHAADPRPDYYRNLPSFDPFYGEDPVSYAYYSEQVRAELMGNENLRQIQWDRLIEANRMNDTIFNGQRGTMAKYIVADRVNENKRYYFNTSYNKVINDHVTFQSGLSHQLQLNNYYREVNDLLGADFFVNLNQFGDLNNTGNTELLQYDVNNPNRILHLGDRYGYDYSSTVNKTMAWAQSVIRYDRFDYFLSLRAEHTAFQREGHVRSGIFLDDSYGKSDVVSFLSGGAKAGITYKYDGRNYFVINGSYGTRAPYFENAFISPTIRNSIVADLQQEKIYSVEGGYLLKAPRLKGKLMGYYTQFLDGTDARRFYHEDYRTFVNYTLTGIDKRHVGIEAALEANVGKGFTISGVASIGQFTYSDRAKGTATQDNADTVLISNETIYWKNIRLAGGPQSAYTLGLNYRSPKFWFATINLNYFDRMYVDVNPARRTLAALDQVDAGSQKWVDILSQEQLTGQYTLDASFGYSWRLNNRLKSLKHPTYLNFNFGLTNILNNENLVTTSFEQLRFDFTDNNVNKFPSKYGYGFGRTFFLNIVYRMN